MTEEDDRGNCLPYCRGDTSKGSSLSSFSIDDYKYFVCHVSCGGKDEGEFKKRDSRLKQGLKRGMLKGVHGRRMKAPIR